MSNIIRSYPSSQQEKKIIHLKKIESKAAQRGPSVSDPVQQKQSLLQEIESLQLQHENLENQLTLERQQAEDDLAAWQQMQEQKARDEAQKLAEQAYAEGLESGFNTGMKQAEEQYTAKRREMQGLIEQAYEEKTKIIRQAEPFLLSLSVRIAEKVIKNELKQHDDQLVHVVQQALKRLEESEDVVMQVALEDYPILIPFLEELKTYIRADSELKLTPVANLSKGGCMIHTPSGSYDVTVSGQIEEIKRQLLAYSEEQSSHEPANR
ncbi:flagellar assembly protein FliH [Planococcus glaciei]|uniref:FliH/SctL family protein n=1 Tax=Planococcus glaciei TaxID=459472 RepID=UPI00069F254E|nr:FliH/SctL family protein [Planococcus glaciei]KOF09904.1 flagellar assembly protein FliH [Planococcus glaciei]